MADQTIISVQVRLSLADAYWFRWRGGFRRRRWYFVFFLLSALATLCSVFNLMLPLFVPVLWSWQMLVAPIAIFVLGPYVFFIAPYLSTRKYLIEHPELALDTTYTFSDRGFDAVDARSETHTDWEQVLEARETATHFLLYVTPTMAHFIGKRFLRQPGEPGALRALVRYHVKKVNPRNS